MLPEPETLDSILRALRSIDASFQIVCDLRGLQNIYNDIPEAIQVLSRFDAHLIARPNEVDFLDEKFGKALHLLRTNGPPIALRYGPIGLLPFLADDWASDNDWKPFARIAGSALPSQQEWEYLKEKNPTINNIFSGLEDLHENWNACRADMRTYPSSPGGREVTQRRYLTHFIANRGRRSLLSELCVQQTSAGLLVTPYHSNALHSLEVGKDEIVCRPAVVANKTNALLSPELSEFQAILNSTKVRERDIQSFLEKNPAIFNRLGYAKVYSQVVLVREDGTTLRPDFILEPVNQSWCDILDIKLPTEKLVVGGRDRKSFSAALTELVSQLREYSAYFDDPRRAKLVESRYGIKCYKPRMLGLIGLDPRTDDERQMRRLMTSYADLSVLTFDQLLRVAKTRILI